MMKIERVTEKIKSGKPVIGTHLRWSDSNIAELLALCGFDYIWIEGEHGALTIDAVQNHVRAIQAHGAAAFFRVPWNDPVLVKPYLEIGLDGIIFPFVNSAKDAEKAVKSCLYPPKGIRGFGPGRSMDFGLMPMDEYLEQAAKIWKIIQIEHIDAVNNIDEILSVEGIDAVVVGQFDLSGSMGLLSQITHPKVLETLDLVASKCRKANIPFSTAMSFNADIVEAWFKRGASFMTLGLEQDFMCQGAKNVLDGAMSAFNKAK